MNRKPSAWLVLAVGVCIVSVGCARRQPAPPLTVDRPRTVGHVVDADETAIRTVLDDVERAMERGDISAVLAHVSTKYHDKAGRGYTELQTFLAQVLSSYTRVEIARYNMEVLIDNDTAAVTEHFATSARGKQGRKDRSLNVNGRTSVFLEKIAGRWLIVEWGESP